MRRTERTRPRWSAPSPTPTDPACRARESRIGSPERTGLADWRSAASSRPQRSRPPVSWYPERELLHVRDLQGRAECCLGRIEADLAEVLRFRLRPQQEHGRVSRIRSPELQHVRHLDLDRVGRSRVDDDRVIESRVDRRFAPEVGEHRACLHHERVGGRPAGRDGTPPTASVESSGAGGGVNTKFASVGPRMPGLRATDVPNESTRRYHRSTGPTAPLPNAMLASVSAAIRMPYATAPESEPT